MNNLAIIQMQLTSLHPYANNPRKNDAAVPPMVEILQEFGFRVPILAKSDGEIIDGHLRYKAAQAMGLAEVPVILADDMSEEQIRAFRVMITAPLKKILIFLKFTKTVLGQELNN